MTGARRPPPLRDDGSAPLRDDDHAPQRDDASARQVEAADPRHSVWLSANAGSGKTRVLTDRVARLLLSGVEPQRILCLTYTKAAAAEMLNRLFVRLGSWSMLPDEALLAELEKLGDEGRDRVVALQEARTLFARAIETPGGLRIQTIHSFCSALLRRFPLEAGVSPRFREMEERDAARLRADVLDEMAAGTGAALVDAIAAFHTGEELDGLAAMVARGAPIPTDADLAAAFPATGAPWAPDARDIAAIRAAIPHLEAGSTTDRAAAAKLRAIVDWDEAAEVLEGVFLTGAAAAAPFSPKPVGTKKTREAPGFPDGELAGIAEALAEARPARLAQLARARTTALRAFAEGFRPAYEAAKRARGLLDFDDLIGRAEAMLSDPAVASWVLYKLDGGVDHILVDEAQDTSPLQWSVIEKLAEEWLSGLGARETHRTLFVVGDPKQSIYSFQGADPAGFSRMRARFAERLEALGEPLVRLELEYSFRSSEAVLGAVDAALGHSGVAAEGMEHRAFKSALPGRVDLWPPVPRPEAEEAAEWSDPVDRPSGEDPDIVLAERIVSEMKRMIDEEVPVPHQDDPGMPVEMRPARPGDFLVLVRSRGVLFDEIIRQCKAQNVDVAGSDRLKVAGELAVRDIAALCRFLALQDDDLSLAEALRSPLLGWSEQRLFDLAHRRPVDDCGRPTQTLWEALWEKRAEHPKTARMLTDLRDATGFLRPYELIERMLTRHGGRRALLARLGPEAEEGIDALLAQALSFEGGNVPTLTGFTAWLSEDEEDVKRQAESARDLVRVMSVHGAKGLEAPVVILPDTRTKQAPQPGPLLSMDEGTVWRLGKPQRPETMAEAVEAEQQAAAEERERLLYVAMTRAESWLVVAGAEGRRGMGEGSWHETVEAGLRSLGAAPLRAPTGEGLRHETGDWGAARPREPRRAARVSLPPWAHEPAAQGEAAEAAPVSPSRLGGAKALGGGAGGGTGGEGADAEMSRRRGDWLHRLLEHLPRHPEQPRAEVARGLLLPLADPPEEGMVPALVAEASRLLDEPSLTHVFEGLPEAAIAARIPGLGTVLGAIDRLVVREDEVLAVDFKSNAVVPARAEDTPEGILRQMGAYAAALAQVYPGRSVRTAILWTREGRLMDLPAALTSAALTRAVPEVEGEAETVFADAPVAEEDVPDPEAAA